ncbi:hypothetical protein HO133_010678 [Letharia lupina]|uniref:PLC-like phosphodiesterase n=1 Tax=Letharia lupina TaxID=560253 RepID=A0A8H6FDR0_9LECA|nr:uncharacterized protein HO133_010678 [Letharia lupina]KAF6224104.1 hypothetical protein HO133_010678 [Letharia lupina]
MLLLLPFTLLLAIEVSAQVASDIQLSGSLTTGTSISNLGGDLLPTGSDVSYISYTTTSTLNGTTAIFQTTMAVANASSSSTSKQSTSTSLTLLQGSMRSSSTSSNGTMMGNSTASRTSTSAIPTNTQACNNYPEFCSRKYSNITYVGAHNSPFVLLNNAASNQQLGVIDQLDDGIRMFETETHYNATTSTVSCCHTSCNLLDVGTVQSYLTNITGWIKTHPYDVVTILLSNSDFIGVGNYSAPIVNSGLSNYAYVPPQIPMNISSWPTLSDMILMGKRAVIFMDYNANQTEVPYILDEFSQMWETPFSPTNQSFPCTQQRPPNLSRQEAENRMYMANHNLNTEISLAGTSLLVPTTALINQTNALNGTGSLGLMANNCAAAWPNSPNFLLVDYYNQGSSPGLACIAKGVLLEFARGNNGASIGPFCLAHFI